MYPKISDNPDVQRFYEERRAEGVSHNIAEICALQQSPGISGTDSQWWAGRWRDTENDPVEQEYAQYAESHGVSTAGKFRLGTLCDHQFPEDPTAWVSNKSEAIAVAKRKASKVAHDVGPPQPYRVNDEIVADYAEEYCEQNPDCTWGEAKKIVREQISPKPREEITDGN